MRSQASAKPSSQYGLPSRVDFGAVVSTCTWTRALTGSPFCARRRISLSVSSSIVCCSVRSPQRIRLRLAHPHHTAGEAAAGIACRLRLQVVGFLVHDYCMAEDRLGASQLHHLVGYIQMRFPARVRFDVAEIARVTV